jgi:TPR repeat protein
MWVRKFLFIVIAAVLGLAGAMKIDLAAGDVSYAPADIERTMAKMAAICLVPGLCPLSAKTRDIIKRAMAGDPFYEDYLGLNLITGDGVPEDNRAGLAWVARAAEDGDPRAARDIADRLRNGAAIEVDETKIATALTARVAKGDVEAMRALGPMIIRGRGVKQDPSQGLAMLERAASLGSSSAEEDLFRLYMLGAPGVPANRTESLKWLAASARHGDAESMITLGYSLLNTPIGVSSNERDVTQSFCWLMRAALLKDFNAPQAQEKLSMIFASGEADERGAAIGIDLVQADLWFRLASRSPFHDNPQIRAMIEPKMTTDEIKDAKRLVEQWRPHGFDELKTLTIALPPAALGGASPRNCPPMN